MPKAEMRKCKEQFHREQAIDDELAASVMLTQALLAEGKQEDAKKEIEAARALATAEPESAGPLPV